MNEFLFSVASNIMASAVFWIGGGALVFALVTRRRRRLRKFFGITSDDSITVYLSSFDIQPNRWVDRYGKVGSHQGVSLPGHEFQAIPSITKIFTSSSVGTVPDIVAGLVDPIWSTRKPTVEFLPSPRDERGICSGNIICLGDFKFNYVTEHFSRTLGSFFRFKYLIEGDANVSDVFIAYAKGAHAGDQINDPERNFDFACLQRLNDPQRGRTVFIAAGCGVNGTRAAALYLANNWSQLHDTYKDQEFGIVLRGKWFGHDPTGYERFEVIDMLPHW